MLKKVTYVLIGALLAALAAFGLTGCKDGGGIEAVSFGGELRAEYVRNEEIDLSDLHVNIVYKGGNEKTYPLPYEGVTVTGGDTSVAGENLSLTVSYKGYEKTFTYSVRNPRLTLDFGDGLYEDKTSVEISAETNYTDVSEYVPEPNELGYEFAGWFYDEEFKKPVKYNFGEGKIDTSSDVTVYAGYDLNYSDKFEYEESSDGKITLTRFNDLFGFGEIYIPATIKLRPVVKIGDDFIDSYAAAMLNFFYLTFATDSSVTEIGDRAFYGVRSFETITLPATLKRIGESAFSGINITSLVIPASVESIAKEAFSTEMVLDTVTFEEGSKLNFLGESAFAYCSALSNITLPETLTVISPYAFNYCSNLEEVYIGGNVKQIGLHAFASCSGLTGISVSEDNANYKTVDGNVYSKDGKTFIRYCFGHNEEEFTLPSGVTSIYESAFDATGLNHILKKINLPETLTNINDYAFKELDVELVIPANVSYLSDKALSQYGGSKFVINEHNPYFTVKDGVVYSKDFKTLIAVPSKAEIETFVLDPKVEVISAGAFVGNQNVKYFIIPADSSLKLIKEGAMSLFKAKNLGGLYIEKAEPFEIEENAFFEKTEYAASAVSLYVAENFKNAYISKFSGVVFTDGVPLSDLIVSVSGAYTNALQKIKEKIEATDAVTETEFATAVDNYINNVLSWSAVSTSFDIYSYFGDSYRILDAAYYAVDNIEKTKTSEDIDFDSADLDFIRIFEEKTINALVDYYDTTDDTSFTHQQSFYSVKNHYLNLPESVSEYLASTAIRFDDIIARTDETIKKQEEIIKTANSIIANLSGGFDVDLAAKTYADYEKYDITLIARRWSDIVNVSALKCSLLINEFLNTPKVPGNLKTLDNLLYEHFEEDVGNVLGISEYLNSGSYFKAQALRKKLYRYDEFVTAFDEYVTTGRDEIVYETNEAVKNYDLNNFDHSAAFAVYLNYANLKEDERNYDYWDKFGAIVLRINIDAFINMELSDETYADASQTYLAIMSDYQFKELTCLPDEDEARFTERIAALFTMFEEKNAEFVAEIDKITKDPSVVDMTEAEKFINLFDDADDIGGYYPVTMTYYETSESCEQVAKTHETNATELYAMLMVIDFKKTIASTFDDVTADNYWDFDKYVSGYTDFDENFIQIEVKGINYYAGFIKSVDCYTPYQNAALTAEEVAKYDELIEKYNNFFSGDFGEIEW